MHESSFLHWPFRFSYPSQSLRIGLFRENCSYILAFPFALRNVLRKALRNINSLANVAKSIFQANFILESETFFPRKRGSDGQFFFRLGGLKG